VSDLPITTPEQHKALAHPLRQRLLFALTLEAATISQLAVQLDVAKGSVGHHLKTLREAGFVHVTETRKVRGGTEQYYQRTHRRLVFDDPTGLTTAAIFAGFAEELTASEDDSLMVLRNVRLTEAEADKLRELLKHASENAADEGPGNPRYGVLVSMYRKRQ
jgi:DNA-binding transcriptional ArsR family regulator